VRAAAEQHLEQVSSAEIEPEIAEDGLEIEVAEDVLLREALLEALRPELVVLLALFRIRQHRVGLVDQFEPLLRGLVARVPVGVQFHRKAPIRLLDLFRACIPTDAEDLVVVLPGHVLTSRRVQLWSSGAFF